VARPVLQTHPTFAAQTSRGQVGSFQLLECFGANSSPRVASRAIGGEVWFAFTIQNRFGHDGSGGISGAQKENIVFSLHVHHPFRVGSQPILSLEALLVSLANSGTSRKHSFRHFIRLRWKEDSAAASL
jgi:hypothetical protein